MSEASIRAQIKAILETVSGVGVVHARRRYSRSSATFQALMTSGGKVNGCMVYRQSTPADRLEPPIVALEHRFKIVYLYELDDDSDSEATFQALLDAIRQKFNSKYSLNGTAMNSGPIQIEDVDTDIIGAESDRGPGTLVHMATLSIDVQERESYTP